MEYSKCNCGAITVIIEEVNYSMPEADFISNFGSLEDHELENEWYGCNHCTNHWGTDICACGSGEPFAECENGYEMCGQPMQSIEEGRRNWQASDAWN